MTRRERAIEINVMSNHACIADERHQCSKRLFRGRGFSNIAIVDIGQTSHFFRNRLTRIHERDEPIHYLALLEASSGNLGQFIVIVREPRRFRIKHNHVTVKFAEIKGFRPRREQCVTVAHGLGCSIAYETLQGIL